MFGGGEEYFREPDAIDRDTLKHFSMFCSRLRALEKPGVKAITQVCDLAKAVGESLQAVELVLGAILRHIKTWTGTKQLSYWYVLDKLCKEGRETFGYTLQPYLVDIASDYIPFDDPALSPKYESMIERWDGVFNRQVIDRIWIARKERIWAAAHPEEVERARRDEEAEWRIEELRQQEIEGLNNFGQPCMDYLQGRCMWGSHCKQLHPPGLEGTLPLECRLGDWKCRCGVINRHFRRRCSQCVREKPQYRKGYEPSAEEKLLSQPDPSLDDTFSQQFGYNPLSETEAVAHWGLRLSGVTTEQFKRERCAAFRVRILKRKPETPLELSVASQRNFANVTVAQEIQRLQSTGESNASSREAVGKRARIDSLIPAGLAPIDAIVMLSRIILERGAHDVHVASCLHQVCVSIKSAVESGKVLDPLQAETFVTMCRMVFSAWNVTKAPHVELFFTDAMTLIGRLGLSRPQVEQLGIMSSAVAASLVKLR